MEIEEHKDGYVSTIDILGDKLHLNTGKEVILMPQGLLSDLMAKIDPHIYRKQITTNTKRKSIIYKMFQNSMHNILRIVIMFYRNIRLDLKVRVFNSIPSTHVFLNNDIGGGV